MSVLAVELNFFVIRVLHGVMVKNNLLLFGRNLQDPANVVELVQNCILVLLQIRFDHGHFEFLIVALWALLEY